MMSDGPLPPDEYLSVALPELVRSLSALRVEMVELKHAMISLADTCRGVAVELRRGREHPTAQTRAERPQVGEKLLPRP
jgi:hypothetical protein